MNTKTTRADTTAADIQIADRVMHAMIVKGVTLKALSETAGITHSTLRRSLHQSRTDRRSFTIEELGNVAAALNLPPAAILPQTYTQVAA